MELKRSNVKSSWRQVLLVMVAAAAALLAFVPAVPRLAAQTPAPAPPAVKKPKGDAEITVAVSDGRKFTACTVYARDQVFTLAAADDKSLARGLPANERIAVTAEARIGEGGSAVRYVGVAEATLKEGKTTKVQVTLGPIKDIDSYCRGCHPSKGEPIPRGQLIRDVHHSGKEIPPKYLVTVRAQNAEVERLLKEGKPANLPILLEERIVKVGGKEVKKLFYTCESCHTLHAVTMTRKYARAEFMDRSDLCLGCHS